MTPKDPTESSPKTPPSLKVTMEKKKSSSKSTNQRKNPLSSTPTNLKILKKIMKCLTRD